MKILVLLTLLAGIALGGSRNSKHTQEYVWDYSVSGGSSAAAINLADVSGKADLPNGAIVEKVSFKVVTALTSAGSADMTAGPSGDADGYIREINHANLGDNTLSSSEMSTGAKLWDDTNDNSIPYLVDAANERDFTISFSDDVTAGKIVFWVEYYYPSED